MPTPDDSLADFIHGEVEARWIWEADEERASPRNAWIRARRVFVCPADLRRATLALTADSRYQLFVNGVWLGFGPARGYPWAYGYDMYDLTAWLRPGVENVLAIHAVHWGDHTLQYIRGRAGLLCALQLETRAGAVSHLVSDAAWRIIRDPALARETPRICVQHPFEERYDARQDTLTGDAGWTHPDFADASWPAARELGPVGMLPWRTLTPRAVPQFSRDAVWPSRALAVELAQPVPGARWTFDLSERFTPAGYGMRAEPPEQQGRALVTEIVARRPCRARVSIHNVGYENLQVALRGERIPSLQATLDLRAGRNLFVLSGTDWPALFFETDEEDAEPLAFDASRMLTFAPQADDATAAQEPVPWAYLGRYDERGDLSERILRAATPDELPPAGEAPRHAVRAGERLDDVYLRTTTQRYLLPEPEAGAFCDASIAVPQPRERVRLGQPLAEDVSALLHDTADATIIYPQTAGDPHLVIDFGREVVGFLTLELDAPEGAILDANLFEGVDESGVFWTPGLRNSFRYTCRAGRQTYRSQMRRGFRYVSLTLRDAQAPVKLFGVSCLLSTYPVERRGRFACEDALLTRIWEVAAYTVQLCMEDTYTDCPAYEQIAWVGDARNSALVNAVAFGASDLTERMLRLTGQSLSHELDAIKPDRLKARPHLTTSHVVSGWFDEIPMWSLLWLWSVEEYYQLTGDSAALAALYPDVRELLERCLAFLTPRGLLDVPDVLNLVDWAAMDLTREGEVTANTVLLVESLRRSAHLAEALAGQSEASSEATPALRADAERWREAAGRIREAVNAHCWSEAWRAYVDTVRDEQAYTRYLAYEQARGREPEPRETFLTRERYSEPTNTLALLCGCVPQDRLAEVYRLVLAARDGHFIGSDPGKAPDWPAERAVPVGSPWFLFFTLEALIAQGDVEAAIQVIREQWGAMIDKGATTFWETFPGFIPGHWSRSLCHGWSAAPAYFLSTQVLGVQPAAPGYARIRVAPQPCGLRWAEGAVPTPRGAVAVHWTRDDAGWEVTLDTPEGAPVELVFAEATARPAHVAGAEGEVAPLDGSEGRWRVTLPGGHARWRAEAPR